MKDNIYRQLIEDSPIPYAYIKLIKDDNNICQRIDILDINKSFKKTFNIDEEEILNKNYINPFDKNQNDKFLEILENTVNKKSNTIIHSHIGNTLLSLEIHNFDKDEYHIRLIEVSNDSNKLSEILRKSPFIAWIKDRDGKYLDVNNKYLELLDVTYNDIIGNSDDKLWGKDNCEIFSQKDLEVIKTNKLVIYDEKLELYDSNTVHFQTAKWPYTDITGNTILGTMGISLEITDKVKLIESIEKNEQNFLDITNNLDEVIVIKDRYKATYVSPYFEKIFGFDPKELYEDINKWFDYWDKLEYIDNPLDLNNKEIYSCTCRVVKYGKLDKWIRGKVIPTFDENGNVLKKVILLKDITSQKNLDDEIENLRLEFFTNLSHELRTPINLLMSTLQVIYPRVNKLDEENKIYLNKYLNILSQNSLRLLKLVNNLIDTTKINSGSFPYNPKNANIITFVEDICTSVVDFVEDNNMNIVFDTDIEQKIIRFDLDHLERILLNLISNAIKFNKENGTIEVTISTHDDIKISVKDKGIGIPEDKIDSIFERFEQVNKEMKREREGSGIGLSLVKSLTELHDGKVLLDSTLGKGSTFTVVLPDIMMSENAIIDVEELPPSLGKINIMDVEFSDIYL